jgi:hypothetical protein
MRPIKMKASAIARIALMACVATAATSGAVAAGSDTVKPHLKAQSHLPVITVANYPKPTNADELDAYIARLEAVEAMKRLQYAFGYYLERGYVDAVADLFADNATADFRGGKFIGKPSIERFLRHHFVLPELRAGDGPKEGVLNEHYLLQPVIDVSPDATRGWMRVRAWNFEGVAGQRQDMSAGIYENTFVKEGGVWKIASLVYCESWRVDYLGDLNRTPIPEYPLPAPTTYPKDPQGPDKVSNYNCRPWPYVGVTPPMHYPHPVTGDYIYKP